ncbi:hypothetical protein BU24DRAFT_456726 [Aaosphaeria arxii CBS 175.79]|uniref:Uncharacterized protein n=1 Tax=Aaosphaeria arxii CBS 175.79 TaxID=1450172 RepID=A0A6A5Y5B1_9PLEO|nr:uncharacterized protein BU24DRAFT_456726 [Aaosphaeria arxii CBS 175.79]KAF2020678.1 hypothetical protein BU24DRAFT_456726 [Aaosphaeria arxii CBS 175.79]
MSAVDTAKRPTGYMSDSDDGHQSTGGRKVTSTAGSNLPPSSANLNRPAGNIVKGPVDDDGKLKDAALLLGIKLDLEAEIHLTARIRGDITIGLY